MPPKKDKRSSLDSPSWAKPKKEAKPRKSQEPPIAHPPPADDQPAPLSQPSCSQPTMRRFLSTPPDGKPSDASSTPKQEEASTSSSPKPKEAPAPDPPATPTLDWNMGYDASRREKRQQSDRTCLLPLGGRKPNFWCQKPSLLKNQPSTQTLNPPRTPGTRDQPSTPPRWTTRAGSSSHSKRELEVKGESHWK